MGAPKKKVSGCCTCDAARGNDFLSSSSHSRVLAGDGKSTPKSIEISGTHTHLRGEQGEQHKRKFSYRETKTICRGDFPGENNEMRRMRRCDRALDSYAEL